MPTSKQKDLSEPRFDSAIDVQFELVGLLNPKQRREVKLIAWLGGILLLLAVFFRLLFVWLGNRIGHPGVPLWFDSIVFIMAVLGCSTLLWSIRKLLRHRKFIHRGI